MRNYGLQDTRSRQVRRNATFTPWSFLWLAVICVVLAALFQW